MPGGMTEAFPELCSMTYQVTWRNSSTRESGWGLRLVPLGEHSWGQGEERADKEKSITCMQSTGGLWHPLISAECRMNSPPLLWPTQFELHCAYLYRSALLPAPFLLPLILSLYSKFCPSCVPHPLFHPECLINPFPPTLFLLHGPA